MPTSLQRPGFPQKVPNATRNSLAATGALAPGSRATNRPLKGFCCRSATLILKNSNNGYMGPR